MERNDLYKKHLRQLFGGADPMDHIQDVIVESTPDATECIVRLKVPSAMSAFYDARRAHNCEPIQVALRRMMDQAIAAAVYGEFNSRGAQKAPEKEPPKPIKPEEKKPAPVELSKPERVVFSGPKTILFWPDGTKTMVSLMEGQEHDEYGAFCAAFLKKMFGSTHKAKKFLETVAVRPEPKVKKRKAQEDEYEQMEMVPMLSTTYPDCCEDEL